MPRASLRPRGGSGPLAPVLLTAIVTTSYPSTPGDPSGHFVRAEARLLARGGRRVVVIAPGARGVHGRSVDADGIQLFRVGGGDAFGWPGAAARVRERPWRALSIVSWAREARLTLAALGDVDRVVAHWAIPSGFPVATARSRGVPLEIVSHGADVRTLTRLPRLVRERIVRRLVAETQTWRFVSRSLQEELARALPSRDAAALDAVSDVVPAAIELPDVRARSAALRVESGGLPFFALVGRLVPSKRFDAALEWVATRHGRPTPRVVVVGDGPDRASLAARARSLGVEAHFVGLTSREEALAWIGAADALVHASRAEGLSTVVREATALGVRVETVP